jgi:P-type E1-E2 ATPase
MGYFTMRDPLRPDADRALRVLSQRGIVCRLVSGDHDDATRAAANRLGVLAAGGLSATAKALVVRDQQHAGSRVLYVRDARPSAAASHADVEIAIAPGTLPHATQAPITLVEPRLDRLAWLVDLARAARRRRIECVVVEVAVASVALPLAALGRLTPWQVVALALAETLIVLANVARLLRAPRPSRAAPRGGPAPG